MDLPAFGHCRFEAWHLEGLCDGTHDVDDETMESRGMVRQKIVSKEEGEKALDMRIANKNYDCSSHVVNGSWRPTVHVDGEDEVLRCGVSIPSIGCRWHGTWQHLIGTNDSHIRRVEEGSVGTWPGRCWRVPNLERIVCEEMQPVRRSSLVVGVKGS